MLNWATRYDSGTGSRSLASMRGDPASNPMKGGGGCIWQFGNDIPGEISNFGQNGQYGTLTPLDYTNPGGSSSNFVEDFRNITPNPCPQA